MEQETADAILNHHDSLRSWPQPFMFDTPHGLIDLTCAIENHASTPENVSMYQPYVYPSWPYHQPVYRFDPKLYCGRGAKERLIFDIRKSLVGVNFFSNNTRDCQLYRMNKLVCSFSRKLPKTTLCQEECFMKCGTLVEPIKACGSTPFDRLDHPKLKRNKKR